MGRGRASHNPTMAPDEARRPFRLFHLARHEHAHRACYERMPHTTSWFAEQLIRSILERHAATSRKYVYEKRVRKGKREVVEQRRYRPHFGVTKVPSESIKRDIETGELSTITLIETKPEYRGPDAPDVVKSVEHKMIIRTKPTDGNKILDYVKTKIIAMGAQRGLRSDPIEGRRVAWRHQCATSIRTGKG